MSPGDRSDARQPPAGGGSGRGSGRPRKGKPPRPDGGDGGTGATGGKGTGGKGTGGTGNPAKGRSPRGEPAQGGKPGGKRGPRRDDRDDPVAQLTGPLQKVLARLPETQRKVLELRMGLVDGHPHDLADTARTLGLSLGEARDIEKRAFEHIREAIPLQQLQRFLDR